MKTPYFQIDRARFEDQTNYRQYECFRTGRFDKYEKLSPDGSMYTAFISILFKDTLIDVLQHTILQQYNKITYFQTDRIIRDGSGGPPFKNKSFQTDIAP